MGHNLAPLPTNLPGRSHRLWITIGGRSM
jgi:hypothetical protein